MVCEECGVDQPSGAGFCGHCGARLVDAPGVGSGRPGGGRSWMPGVVVMVAVAIGVATVVWDGVSAPGAGRDAAGDVVMPTEPVAAPSSMATTPSRRMPVLVSRPTGPDVCMADSATSLACPRWSVESPREVLGRPSTAGRQVLIGVGASVAALRTTTGEVIWQAGLAHQLSAAPVVEGELVVVVDDAGVVVALDRGTGRQLWRYPLGSGSASLVVTPEVVVAGGPGGEVVGLDADDGTPRWRVAVSGQPGPLAADATAVFVGDGNGEVRAIDLDDGDVRWTARADGWYVALADAGRVLVVSGFEGPLVAFDPQTGDQLWESDVDVAWAIPHPLPDGSVVIQTGDELRRIDTADGTSLPLVDGSLDQSLVVDPDGLIYRWTTGSRVDVVDPDGTLLWTDETGLALHDLAVDRAVDSSWMVATLGREPTTVVGTLAPVRAPPDAIVSVAAGQPCPTTPIVDRPYRPVAAGAQAEVAGLGTNPDASVTMVMDVSHTGEPLTISGRQLDGPGRMGFRRGYNQPPQAALVLSDIGKRSARGWPPHLGIVASISAPGCWAYEIANSDGTIDQIVVEITSEDFEALTAVARHQPDELQ